MLATESIIVGMFPEHPRIAPLDLFYASICVISKFKFSDIDLDLRHKCRKPEIQKEK